MSDQIYYEYKRIKYKLITKELKKELKIFEKPIDKSAKVCYNKGTK